jgi:tRNA U34 5-carboxymethylaminomethyl modifying GTPase MnmE/TrmE
VPGTDTIAAVATPPGRGGIGIVRVSGEAAPAIATAILGRLPRPRQAALHAFRDAEGGIPDRGLALYFPAPGSYTGEPVLELQGHGGPVVLDRILARVLSLGARAARPGEFTERAFLNARLELAQAEAVADLIDAVSERAARSEPRSPSPLRPVTTPSPALPRCARESARSPRRRSRRALPASGSGWGAGPRRSPAPDRAPSPAPRRRP